MYIEAEFIDPQYKQTVAKVVREVLGTQLKNASQAVTASDFKLAIDQLTNDLQAFIR